MNILNFIFKNEVTTIIFIILIAIIIFKIIINLYILNVISKIDIIAENEIEKRNLNNNKNDKKEQ